MRHLAAASIVAVLTMAGCASATPDNATATQPPPATASVPAPAPGMSGPSPSEAPFRAPVYALDGDAVVRVDPDTGEVTRRYGVGDAGDGLADVEYVSKRDVVLVTRTRTGQPDEIVELSLADGGTRVLAEGRHPAVSADGNEIAFVRTVHKAGRDELELVHATYDGGEESVWDETQHPGRPVALDSLSWSPTNEELVFILRSDTGVQLRRLPVDRRGSIRGTSELIEPTAVGATYSAVAFRDPATITVAEGCCESDDDARWTVSDLTLETRGQSDLLTDLHRPVSHLDWTLDQDHLAVTLGEVPLDTKDHTVGGDEPPLARLWTLEHTADLRDGLRSAEW